MTIPTFIEMSGAIFRKAKFELSNDRVKTLGSNPLAAIPAPGPGHAINVLSATLSVRSTVAYVTGGKRARFYIGATVSSFVGQFNDGMFTGGNDLVEIQTAVFFGNDDLANVENLPVTFGTEDNADYTGGVASNIVIVEFFFHLLDV